MDNGPTCTFTLSLLGRFELTGPAGGVEIASKKAAGLLAFLACKAPVEQRRETLTDLLWGSQFEAQARQNLRQALYVLRRILGDGSIATNGRYVALKTGALDCDVPHFEALIREGSRDALVTALEVYKGHLLVDLDFAQEAWRVWLTSERQRLEKLALDALVRLGELELASGKAEAAVKAADRAIAENDVREDAHRLLIQALAASGRRPDALRHYEHLVTHLKRELDVEPDATTKALIRELRQSAQAGTEREPDRSSASRRPAPSEAPSLPLPDRPSIAVLPFANMSGDPDQEYFADGISEDLITGLSHIHWLFVIARNSTFVYKHRAVDVKQVARELGVRYVLEGSVRRTGKRLRISAQLIDAMTGGHHWAERYDRELGDIFAVQDEITRSVAAAIEPRLLAAEGVRALSRSADDLGAWDLVARAQTHFWRLTRPDYERAIDSLEQAVDMHPEYAAARSLLGFCLVFAAHMGWIDRERGLLSGREHANRAIALDDRDPWAHIALGYWAMMERRTGDSIAAFRRAVSLNPNSAAAHSHLSRGLAFAGQDREAIAHGEDAIRLSPLDPEMALFLGAIAVAHYAAGRYPEAAQYTTEALRLRPGFQGAQRLRCASLAQAGRFDEARSFLATVRREQPQLSIDWIRESVPYQTPQLMECFLDGMRKAGLNGD
jgi:TolB-like protein/DNA-binding SARP family transcriptional activator/Flp pilus assembly protein TadD